MNTNKKFLCSCVDFFAVFVIRNYGLHDTSYSSKSDFHKQLDLKYSVSKPLQLRFTKDWMCPGRFSIEFSFITLCYPLYLSRLNLPSRQWICRYGITLEWDPMKFFFKK